MSKFERRDLLLNDNQIEILNNSKIMIFGLGGVGGYVFEALIRMGIKNLSICDGDNFQESNLNRQILSTIDSINKPKVEIAISRALQINEECHIEAYDMFINKDNIDEISFNNVDYIIDAIDDVNAKVLLIKKAKELNISIISMMGAGNRLKANFIVSDIYKTKNDPLSKKMRNILKKENIDSLKVIYTTDLPNKLNKETNNIGSISYVVGLAGLTIAQEVISDLLKL